MNRMVSPVSRISFMTFLRRSSNSPRYLLPATSAARSSVQTCLPLSNSGTSWLAMRWAKPSTMAVLPTPGSPMSTGLFLVRRLRICMTRSISVCRPMHGSSLPSSASLVRLRPNWSRTLAARLLSEPPARLRAAAAGAAERAHDLVADLLGLGVEVEEDARGHSLVLAHEAEQDVFGADVVVAEAQGLTKRQLEDLLGARREGDLALR